jgi:alpha-L-fucosidase 2
MLHVWDHFDYTNDVAWFKQTGWPLLKVKYGVFPHEMLEFTVPKGVASFHLDNVIEDLHFNDSTLVVNPCNSPEQVPITFGNYFHHEKASMLIL